jgi:CHAP domain
MISKTVGSGLLELKTKPSVATSILKTNNKSMKTKIFALLAVLVMFAGVMTSCDKSDYEPMALQQDEGTLNQDFPALSTRVMASNGSFGWTYYPDPSVSYASSPDGSTYPGYGGQYIGGYFQASLVDNYGSYSVKIERIDGSSFTQAGTAHIKIGSLYASSAGSVEIHVGDRSVYIPVSIPLNSSNTSQRGVLNIWSMIISGNDRFFSYPIMIWTSPMFTSRSTNGQIMGFVDNVPIYKAVAPSKYQCVEFCKRYYAKVYKMSIGSVGTAINWYNNASNFGFKAYVNGTEEPRVGDAVCWSGGSTGAGHIGVIIEVGSNFVRIAHQNGKKKDAIGMTMTRIDSKTLQNSISNLTFEGIMRKKS